MIKKTIFLSLFFYSNLTMAQRHGCPLEDTLFFAFIKNHTKAVEVCHQNNNIKLTYGEAGKPDIIIEKDISKVNFFYYGPGTGLRIIDGENSYEVMGKQFTDSVLKFKIDGNSTYQILDSRDENFINYINR